MDILQKASLICSTVHWYKYMPVPYYKGALIQLPLLGEPSLPWSKVSLEEGFLLKCSHRVHKRAYLPKMENTVISSQRDRDKFQVQFKYGKAGSHMLLAGGQGEQDVSCGH